MKCPDCGEYSLTYDWERNGFVCHVYDGFIPAEHMPETPAYRLWLMLAGLLRRLTDIGVFG